MKAFYKKNRKRCAVISAIIMTLSMIVGMLTLDLGEVSASNYNSFGTYVGGNIVGGVSADEMVQNLCGPNTEIKNAKIRSVSGNQYGIGTDLYVDKTGSKNGICGNESFTSGVILTNGNISNAFGYGSTNCGGNASSDKDITSQLPNSYSKAYDWVVLEFDVKTDNYGFVGFSYVYLTSEINYHGTSFVDPFALYVDGTKASYYSSKSSVNVNNQYNQRFNADDTYFYNNGSCISGAKYNAISAELRVGSYVQANEWHHVKFVLADAGDHILDTTVILRANSLTSDPNYSADTISITYDANGHGTAPEPATGINSGDNITVPSMSDPDYNFNGWYMNANGTGDAFTGNNITGNATVYAKWTPKEYTAQVTVNNDGTAWADQKVELFYAGKCEFTLTDNGDGVYRNNQVTVNGASKTFDIYVNGIKSDGNITIYRENAVTTIDLYTFTVIRQLNNDMSANLGTIRLSTPQNGVIASTNTTAGEVSFHMPQGTYYVELNGAGTGDKMTYNVEDAAGNVTSVLLSYYDVNINLTYSENWQNAGVVLRQNDKETNLVPYAENNGNVYTYRTRIRGDVGNDNYQVYVNDKYIEQDVKLDAEGFAAGKTTAAATYYKVDVTAKLNGISVDNRILTLRNGQNVEYQLKATGNGLYTFEHVRVNEGDTYGLYVGTEATGKSISSANKTATVNMYTITYMKDATHLYNTVEGIEGQIIKKLAGPYISGKTFIAWYEDASLENAFSFGALVTGQKTLYAGYTVPIVRINSYSSCTASVNQEALTYTGRDASGTDMYYMPAFSITGFPEGNNKIIKYIIIEITNGYVYVEPADGVNVDYNNTANGNGGVKISFAGNYSAAETVDYVRNHIVFKPINTSSGTIVVKVNGTTAD